MPSLPIAIFSLLALIGAMVGCADAPPPSVLLVTIDTLRADALGAYGAQPSPSPNLDALARESTVYEHALAPLPMTRPSHFSLFTSRYPRDHGVLNNRMALPEQETTLAEVFRDNSFRTAAFTSVALLGTTSGVGQGFEHLSAPRRARQRAAAPIVGEALDWIGSLESDERFFAWIHLFDPHQPYEQLDASLGDVDTSILAELPRLEWPDFYRIAEENDGDIPRAVFEHALALYRAEVAWVDRWVGVLLEGVRSQRELDDVIVVVTSDHGECFENGIYFEHSDCMQHAALRVPLIVRHPRRFTAGARVDAPVSLLDVGPALLEAAGIAAPASFGGHPLQDENRREREVLVQYPFYQPSAVQGRLTKRKVIRSVAGVPTHPVIVDEELVGIVTRDWKYLRSGAKEELYRLGESADETRNVAPDEEAARSEMSARLDALLQIHPLVVLDSSEINEELRETLEALGYIQ